MNDTCKERIGNRDYVTFRADTEIPYGLLSTDSNTSVMGCDMCCSCGSARRVCGAVAMKSLDS